MMPTRIVADILLGCILVAVLANSLLIELALWLEKRPYRRDVKRAASIREHSLLQIPDEKPWREIP